MTTSLEAVLARVAKELERSMSPHNHPGTAYVGGITKLGANLDAYLLDVWCWSCATSGIDPSETARRQRQPILLDRASAGQLLHLLSTLAKLPVATDPAVEWVIAEARDGSALHRALELRNAIVHGRETPDVATIRTSLERLQRALGPQLERLRRLA